MFGLNMLNLVVFAVLICMTVADHIDKNAEIRNYVNEVNADGSFRYSFESSNGINLQESGVGGQSVSGSAGWVAPDGVQYQLTWTADATGFHPQGNHLPTPPPVPEGILRALEIIRVKNAQQQQQQPIQQGGGGQVPLQPVAASPFQAAPAV